LISQFIQNDSFFPSQAGLVDWGSIPNEAAKNHFGQQQQQQQQL
jgi:hypothetical protein